MYLIDTNVYSALDRGEAVVIDILRDEAEVGVLLPVIAELRYGFMLGSRTKENEQNLQRFVALPAVSVIQPTEETTRYYAELQFFCRQQGCVLSQNDIWIAALTRETDNTLLTFDKDFEALRELLNGHVQLLGRE